MTTSRSHLLAACCSALVLAPIASAAVRPPAKHMLDNDRRTLAVAPSAGASLIVTFADRPTYAQAIARLGGLGAVSPLVPQIGVWQLTGHNDGDTAAQAARRPNVIRVEWSRERRHLTLPKRRPPIAPLAQISVPTPTDPLMASQWSMQTGRWTPSLTGRPERPKIAILDTGLDTASPDWKAQASTVSGWDVVHGVAFVGDGGVEGHGTHVAGIAAAPANGVGVVGVAPASGDPAMPGARVIAVKITFRDSGGFDVSTDATQMAGIVYAVNHGAKVINISSGGPGYNQAFQDTVDWAMKRGALVVASVGNDGQGANDVNYPAGYDHVVGVAASCDTSVDGFDCLTPRGRATFSNFNFSVDVLAPGVRVLSTLPTRVADPAAPAGYGYLDGTSMAAPYVTGTAALVASSHPNASPYQVLRVIESTADRAVAGAGRSSKLGWGELNPARAVNATAPRNDLNEPNDDVNWLQKRFDIALTRTARVVSVTAHADYNDDHLDVYAVPLAQGRRVRVTLSSTGSRLAAFAFDGKGRIAPELMSDTQFDRRLRGMTKTSTPGKRSFTFTARRTGRHFIQVVAGAGGTAGEYTLRVERLN